MPKGTAILSEERIRKKIHFTNIFEIRESVTVLILVGYVVAMVFLNPVFFRVRNLLGLATAAAMLIPVTICMQTLLATGVFDLSVGSVAALASMTTGLLLVSTRNIWLSVFGGMLVGACFGFLNGFLVTKLKINALIVTLATMGIARAIALGMVSGQVLTGFPREFSFIGQATMYNVPVSVFISIAMIIVADFAFRKIPYCRRFFYVGADEQAATYCGINTSRVTMAAFVLGALGTAFAGILITSRTMASSPSLYQGLPLEVIAACVIGGASLRGGEGSIIGAVMGLFIIVITRNVMVLLNVSVYWKELVVGLILITAVTVDVLGSKKGEVPSLIE